MFSLNNSTAVRKSPDYQAIVEQALRELGTTPLPACLDPSQKHPCIPWGGFQTRHPNRKERRQWIKKYPNRNGLYVTGKVLGRIVLDVDDREGEPFQWVCDQGFPPTQTMFTRRGFHLHFQHPGFKVGNSAGKIHPDVDIRGDGGVAMAAGSVHSSGYRYQWLRGFSPQDVPLAKAPAWLLDWLRRQGTRRNVAVAMPLRDFSGVIGPWAARIVEDELQILAETPEGQRNPMLARVAFKLGQLVGGGEADLEEIRQALYETAASWSRSGENLVPRSKQTIDRCLTDGVEYPRTTPVI